MKHQHRYFIVTASLTLATLIAACSDSTSPNATSATDQAFIDGMTPHHQQALLSADMAIARAVHPELAQFAQQMKTDQQNEVTLLKS
jgi:uncharacterized protein (DUF305 family)